MKNKREGFSLIECLISLALFLIVILGSLEIYNTARDHFMELKHTYETQESIFATLDKIKLDLSQAGKGLLIPLQQGLVNGLQISEESLDIYSAEAILTLSADLQIGQTRIDFPNPHSIKQKRQVCVINPQFGEINTVTTVSSQSIVLSSALQYEYPQKTTHIIVLRKISYYLDEKSHILRRKVNTSPAQPLLEETATFFYRYDISTNLANIQISLLTNKDVYHEVVIFPKNLRLVEHAL